MRLPKLNVAIRDVRQNISPDQVPDHAPIEHVAAAYCVLTVVA